MKNIQSIYFVIAYLFGIASGIMLIAAVEVYPDSDADNARLYPDPDVRDSVFLDTGKVVARPYYSDTSMQVAGDPNDIVIFDGNGTRDKLRRNEADNHYYVVAATTIPVPESWKKNGEKSTTPWRTMLANGFHVEIVDEGYGPDTVWVKRDEEVSNDTGKSSGFCSTFAMAKNPLYIDVDTTINKPRYHPGFKWYHGDAEGTLIKYVQINHLVAWGATTHEDTLIFSRFPVEFRWLVDFKYLPGSSIEFTRNNSIEECWIDRDLNKCYLDASVGKFVYYDSIRYDPVTGEKRDPLHHITLGTVIYDGTTGKQRLQSDSTKKP